jgi:hypothetical protein
MGLFSTGAGTATRAARDAATARQGRAGNLTLLTDSVFNDPRRESGVQDFMTALRGQLGQNTMRGFADTARRTKFATARTGLTGGRVDVDRQGRNLEDLFRRQISDESQVQDAGNSLRTQDQATRQSLLDTAWGAANTGQDAMRGMIGQQAQNSNYLSALWPSLFQNTAGTFADAYRRRREGDVYAGAGGV